MLVANIQAYNKGGELNVIDTHQGTIRKRNIGKTITQTLYSYNSREKHRWTIWKKPTNNHT